MSCGVCGCRLSPCRCDLPDDRDFFKYGESFIEIAPPQGDGWTELMSYGRHTCRYEPPERRILPCQGCVEGLTAWPELTSVQLIHDHVREGRISAEDGARLLALREELRRARRPWYVRAGDSLGRLLGLW